MVEDEAADAGESAVATMYNPFAALDTLRFCIIPLVIFLFKIHNIRFPSTFSYLMQEYLYEPKLSTNYSAERYKSMHNQNYNLRQSDCSRDDDECDGIPLFCK